MASRLFVGNLPYSCTEEEVRGLFEPRWQVVEARIVTDRETGRSRGFAFVELETPEAAQEAIGDLDGRELGGRRLAVREAHERQGGKPNRPRYDERSAPSVDTITRRTSPSFREPHRDGGAGRRWEPPRQETSTGGWDAPAAAPDDKDRRRERRKKKRERHEPDW
jgi:RNA recognition motif-containing protein